MISAGIVTVSYIVATILFILALGGLSNQETARRGNWYGIIGMAIALIATILGVVTAALRDLARGAADRRQHRPVAAARVQMTQMPELVAILHSLVGLAAVAVGFANFMDPDRALRWRRADHSRHRNLPRHPDRCRDVLGFRDRVWQTVGPHQRQPAALPARHWLNLGLLLGAIWFGREFVLQSAAGGGMSR